MTIDYLDGERLAEEQVKAVSGFSDSNVARGRWKLLNSGNSDHYAILKQGEISRDALTISQKANNNRTMIELWQRYADDNAYDKLQEHAANITARFDQYRKLSDNDGSLRDANITGRSVVTEQWRQNGDGPSWLKVDLYLDWSNDEQITFAE